MYAPDLTLKPGDIDYQPMKLLKARRTAGLRSFVKSLQARSVGFSTGYGVVTDVFAAG